MNSTDTIAAIATAQAAGGIGIVRISGSDSVAIAEKIFVPVSGAKLTRSKGGFSIAVHPPGETQMVDDMLLQNRVDFALTADYSTGSELERVVQAILRQIAAVDECARLHAGHLDGARRRIEEREARPVTYEGTWMGVRE